jgi:glucose-1-phosphate thymidylyltransferase
VTNYAAVSHLRPLIGREFIGKSPRALVLGDNIFYGHGMSGLLGNAAKRDRGATVFGYYVAEFDGQGKVVGLEEKPQKPKSNYAVTGLYFYDDQVVELASTLKPSKRGELEITDLNRLYLEQGSLQVELFGRGVAWLDTGTHESLMQASNFIQTVEERQNLKVACPEEVAYIKGWIGAEQVLSLAEPLKKTGYGQYLIDLIQCVR